MLRLGTTFYDFWKTFGRGWRQWGGLPNYAHSGDHGKKIQSRPAPHAGVRRILRLRPCRRPLCGLLACWLAGLLACWLAGLLACWLAGWLAGLLACWLAGWLADEVDIHKQKQFKLFFSHREKDSQGIFFWVRGLGRPPPQKNSQGFFLWRGDRWSLGM